MSTVIQVQSETVHSKLEWKRTFLVCNVSLISNLKRAEYKVTGSTA